MKKIVSMMLAAMLLLQPVMASAATWSDISASLLATGSYNDGSTTAQKDGDKISVSGGTVEDVFIHHAGSYTFDDVTVQGPRMLIQANGVDIVVTLNAGTVFETSIDGVDAEAHSGGSVVLNNHTVISGKDNSLYIEIDGDGQVTVQGSGSISGAQADGLPVEVWALYGSKDEGVAAVLNNIKIDQQLNAAQGSVLADICVLADGETHLYVDENGTLYTYNDRDEKVILAEGFITFGEAAEEEEPYDDLKAQREAEEALRQARAVGGVTTSIFWNKQMYLGHSTYNGRVYYQGKTEMTLQSLNWLPSGAANGKNYTLCINKENVNLADVEIRLAQDILDVCERAGIKTITVVDKNMNPLAQFEVNILIIARKMYDLKADELICVSMDMNTDIMKVTSDGRYVPIEEGTAFEDAAA